jgi:hypothetical protein
MKKILLAALAAGLMSTNAMAWWLTDAQVEWIETKSDGNTYVRLIKGTSAYNYKIADTDAEAKKTMIAVALTGLSTQNNMSAEISGTDYIRLFIKR